MLDFTGMCDMAISNVLAAVLAYIEEVFRISEQCVEFTSTACGGLAMVIGAIEQTLRHESVSFNHGTPPNAPANVQEHNDDKPKQAHQGMPTSGEKPQNQRIRRRCPRNFCDF